MSSMAAAIIASCKRNFAPFYNDCSGFLKAVAQDCGVVIVGQANDILDLIEAVPTSCIDGVDAARLAKQGKFVIGGVKASANGHVVVVVDGPMSANGKHPYAFWGAMRTMSVGGVRLNVGKLRYGHSTVNYAFNSEALKEIRYAYFDPIPALTKRAGVGEDLILRYNMNGQ